MRLASRWFGDDLAQHLKNFAVILGRLPGLHFLLRVADQRAQALRVGLRMSGEQLGQRAVVFHQTVAPAFQLVHIRDVMLRFPLPCVQLGEDGRGIHFAHQLADVLHLAALRAELVDVLHLADRIAQVLGDVELRDLVLAQLGQFLAEVAQLVHLLLYLGLARRQFLLILRNLGLIAQAAPPGICAAGTARMGVDDLYVTIIVFLGIMFLGNVLILRNLGLIAQAAPPGICAAGTARMGVDDLYVTIIVFLGIMFLGNVLIL